MPDELAAEFTPDESGEGGSFEAKVSTPQTGIFEYLKKQTWAQKLVIAASLISNSAGSVSAEPPPTPGLLEYAKLKNTKSVTVLPPSKFNAVVPSGMTASTVLQGFVNETVHIEPGLIEGDKLVTYILNGEEVKVRPADRLIKIY